MKDLPLPYTDNNLIQDLILRYRERLRTVFSNRNPYNNALWEKSEIEQWVNKLEKCSTANSSSVEQNTKQLEKLIK